MFDMLQIKLLLQAEIICYLFLVLEHVLNQISLMIFSKNI